MDEVICEIFYELPTEVMARLPKKYGVFRFAAYGCAVCERQTPSGMYVYTAVNMSTGQHEILSRRKRQIDVPISALDSGVVSEIDSENTALSFGCTAINSLVQKIKLSPIRGEGLYTTDKPPDKSEKFGKVMDVANHIFSNILPRHGYAVREKQIELTEHILDAISKRAVTLAESEVGTGKTHAYLIASVLAKRGRLNDGWLRGHYRKQSWAESAHLPVVISTSSIALQNAIIADYIPELSRILMEHDIIRSPLTAVIRKGKEHFICEKRLLSYHYAADLRTKKLLEPYIGRGSPFDLTVADSLSPYIKRRICVMEKCGESCKYREVCRYQRYLKKAGDSKVDFQITNHNYFLADTLHRVSGKRPLIPDYQLVIIDEGHKFLQAARQMYGLELTDKELPALAEEVHAITVGKSNSGVNIHRLAKKMSEQSGKIFDRLNERISPFADDEAERFPAVLDENISRNLRNITNIAADLAESLADSYVRKSHEERRSRVIWRLGAYEERINALRKQANLIHWFEKRVEGETKIDALCGIPKDLNERLYKDLWGNGIPIILTSGTLSAGIGKKSDATVGSGFAEGKTSEQGDFSRAKETLGLDYLRPHKLFSATMPSPFNYKENTLLYISENMPFPDNRDKRYIAAVADEVERLVIASHGHAAVLFTSYNAMGQVHAILKQRNLPFPLFRLERRGVQAIERFKQSGNIGTSGAGILFASGALWEGIDIPGDALSMLIIVKLPFAFPDPIGDYEREQCGSMAAYKERVVVPDMLVKLKQGYGRLIRSETDTGVVAILDCRANERGTYRRRVLSALPVCNVTSDIDVVRRFFVAKKPPDYFLPPNYFL